MATFQLNIAYMNNNHLLLIYPLFIIFLNSSSIAVLSRIL